MEPHLGMRLALGLLHGMRIGGQALPPLLRAAQHMHY